MVIGIARVSQCLVKQRFKNVVEEIRGTQASTGNVGIVGAVDKQMANEVFLSPPPRLTASHTEPSFLLEKVEEDDLAKELLRKVVIRDAAVVELGRHARRGLQERGESIARILEKFAVVIEELLGDFLDAESGFECGNRRVGVVGLEQLEKLLLRGMAVFVLSDEVAVTTSRRELKALRNQTQF